MGKESKPACAKGWTMKNGKCFKTVKWVASCPKGYKMKSRFLMVPCVKGTLAIVGGKKQKQMTRCVKKMPLPKIKCNRGFKKVGNKCFPIIKHCPSGFVKKHGKCVALVPTCKKGFKLSK